VLLGFDPGGGNPKAGEMATLPVDFVPESDSVASLFPTMDAPEAPKRLLVEGVGDATGFCPVSPGVVAVVDALVDIFEEALDHSSREGKTASRITPSHDLTFLWTDTVHVSPEVLCLAL
jgi:hypothetical protein